MNFRPVQSKLVQQRKNDKVICLHNCFWRRDEAKNANKTTWVGKFIGPQLEYFESKLNFKYKWDSKVLAMPIQKPLDISKFESLTTTITLKIIPPFSWNTEVLILPPGHKETINIDFDHEMRQDKISGVNESKHQITHKGHP